MSAPPPLTSTPAPTDPTSATTSNIEALTSMPELTFYHHPFSPFARKVWMTALEHNLTQHITLKQIVVAPVVQPKAFPGWSEHNDLLGKFNPIAKIPTLVVREQSGDAAEVEEYAVYDSKIICEFLVDLAESVQGDGGSTALDGGNPTSRGRKPPSHWKRQALHRLADQMMDSEILVAYEERMREAEGIKWDEWITGMRKKIERGAKGLRIATEEGLLSTRSKSASGGEASRTNLTLEEVAAACCLGFLDIRSIPWRLQGSDGPSDKLAEWYESCKQRPSWESSRPDVKWVGKTVDGS